MLPYFESWLHRVRRQLSRSEWAIRHLGLTPSEGTSEAPGLLLILASGLLFRVTAELITHGRQKFGGELTFAS